MMTHVDEGLLVRLMDGELDGEERQDIERHLDACTACMDRLDALRADADAVHEALLVWDDGVSPRRQRVATWLRAAAVIIVALGVAGGVKPVRAWIIDGAQVLWSALAGDRPSLGQTVVAPPLQQSTATVSFTPATAAFLLELTSRQQLGTLLIETADLVVAEAEVIGGSRSENLVVLPTGLRIENGPTSAARYIVRLPRSLAVVRVTVAGESTLAIEPAGVTSRWEIDLVPVSAAAATHGDSTQ